MKKFDEIVFLLQGGGALGAYQAGAVEALTQEGIQPNWLIGISIGALNTAIIAGNAPQHRVNALKAFWTTICSPQEGYIEGVMSSFFQETGKGRKLLNGYEANKTILKGQKGFFSPKYMSLLSPLQTLETNTPDNLSYYDTSPLKKTLLNYADFNLINNQKIRVSVGAVDLETSENIYFDNTKEVLTPEHFMASGALPPGFPAVKINNRYYWDGGIVSNTPMMEVMKQPNLYGKNIKIFQMDLWKENSPIPQTFDNINERIKDLQYSARSPMVSDLIKNQNQIASTLKELIDLLPKEIQQSQLNTKKIQNLLNPPHFEIEHLIYHKKGYEGAIKDFEFSQLTMQEHWNAGIEDVNLVFKHQIKNKNNIF